MNKELKALELIKLDYGVEPQGYELIKSALKRKEKLEKFLKKHQKEHQAISILKSKYINLFVFNLSSTYDEYCKLIGDRCCISEKEYKLIKEVFKRL